MIGDKPTEEWLDAYEESHSHPFNRCCHVIGIPMLTIALPLFLLLFFYPGIWWLPVSLYVGGWALLLIGHAVEGKRPDFVKDWRFLLFGLAWWFRTVRRRS